VGVEEGSERIGGGEKKERRRGGRGSRTGWEDPGDKGGATRKGGVWESMEAGERRGGEVARWGRRGEGGG